MAVPSDEQPVPPTPTTAPTQPIAPDAGPAHEPTVKHGRGLPRTRTGTAWASIVTAVLLLILLVIFIAQNTHPVDVSFLMLHGRFPLAVALLAAVAGGALVAVIGGTLRMVQLRRAVPRRVPRRHGGRCPPRPLRRPNRSPRRPRPRRRPC
ncbi:lipopolysaccharide assembly protein LapA domain-containing protein [Streptacidiphilus sp. PAMC 29251]